MVNTKINKFKAKLISGVVAISAMITPFTAAVTPSVTANAADTDNYAKLLQYSLYFYDANMCGDNSTGALSWRSNCHMTDEVKGGFHDAGDHAMFGLPQGFAASTLEWSYYEFGDAFDKTGQTDHLKVITDHFCQFFKDSTKLSGSTVTNFLYMKGEGHEDHNYWGPPEQQGSREMFWTSNGASDIAAEYAAALAANYKNFGNAEDLTYAKALYNFSTQYNQPFSCDFYGSNSVADDQAWAAGWLYIATGENQYLNDLKSKLPPVGWVHGWNDVHLGAACLLGEITGDWSAANGYMAGKATGSNYLFLDKWGSARLNCSMQFTSLVATAHQEGNYTDWAKGQMNYILGQNPANTCFVTGFASNSAKNAHHRAASGYTSYSEFPTGDFDENNHLSVVSAYGPNSHTLIGALVGGPCDAGGTYHDNMADYICNEVAIDYNAGLVGAAAGLYHFYGTGSIDTSIEGVTKIYSGSSTPVTTSPVVTTTQQQAVTTTSQGQQQVVTTTQAQQSATDKTLTAADMSVGQEKGDDGATNNYAEFAHNGAKSVTLYLKVNSSDTEVSGAFGTWNGDWLQEDFTGVKVGSDKIATIDYTIPSNAGSNIKAMVFWPHGDDVSIEKVVLHFGGTSTVTTTAAPITAATTTTTRANVVTTTQAQQSATDKTLTAADMSVGQEKGDDGATNNYAEFAHNGAKSVTLYLKVNSSDTEVSGAFGTWNGDWQQKDFVGVKVGSDKIATVDYVIPSDAGSTIKAMVFWPHGDDVSIEKVVLHFDSTSTVTTTAAPVTAATTTKTNVVTTTQAQDGNYKAGDANCDGSVNMSDVVLIMQSSANPGQYQLTAQGKKNADVTGGGDGVTNNDALAIQRFEAGLVTSLPID